MNFKALITTLVLGSSSIALADPSWSGGVSVQGSIGMRGNHDGDADDYVRDHRVPLPVYQPAPAPLPIYQPQWVQLVRSAQLVGNRQIFDLDTTQQFRKLQLRSIEGMTHIERIVVKFRSGRVEVLRPDVTLDAKNCDVTLSLQLHGRIDTLQVFGRGGRYGRYSILAG